MYKVYVTDAYFICKDGVCDWATDVDKSIPEFESKKVEEHETVAAALESVSDWGSRWVMYPSLVIENDEGEEVYSDYACVTRCECCKHEELDRVCRDMRTMKGKDGKLLFPDIH